MRGPDCATDADVLAPKAADTCCEYRQFHQEQQDLGQAAKGACQLFVNKLT